MKNLITLTSSLTIIKYKTYKSYLHIDVLPRSCVFLCKTQLHGRTAICITHNGNALLCRWEFPSFPVHLKGGALYSTFFEDSRTISEKIILRQYCCRCTYLLQMQSAIDLPLDIDILIVHISLVIFRFLSFLCFCFVFSC